VSVLLPFGYVLRNLLRRRARTIVTLAGIAATSLLVVAMASFAGGIASAGAAAAQDDVAVLLGSSAEVDLVRSVVPRGSAEVAAAAAPGVSTVGGVRAASVELHIASRVGDDVALLRGVTDAAWLVHRRLQIVDGREPRAPFELVVGPLAHTRIGLPQQALAVGSKLQLERREFTVVGRFVAPGTTMEAEIWGRLTDVMLATKREDVSCVVVRMASADAFADLQLFAARRLDLEIAAVSERELLRALTASLDPVIALAHWMAVLAMVAGAFACANTMFAAVLARTRELATLRSLGWSPFAVGLALVQESALVALCGGAIGTLLALAIGDVSLRYPMGALALVPDAGSRGLALVSALASGVVGGIVPAVRAVRIPLVEAIGGRT
jgi:putative ABC transport system permease protein